MLNWIVWNRTIFIKMDLALNNLQKLICQKNPTNQPTNQPTKNWHKEYKMFVKSDFLFNLLVLTSTIIAHR